MMFGTICVGSIICIVLLVFAEPVKAGFRCKGKPDGNYRNPDNCYGYIFCLNDIAHEMDCPAGMKYNVRKDQCDYDAPCFQAPDPCTSGNYQTITSSDRLVGNTDQCSVKCDRDDLIPGWYRFTGDAGDKIPNTRPQRAHRCGTHAPGWINGSNPAVANGEVIRTVCYFWWGNDCRWQNSIKVKNCGEFYVYELQKPPLCWLRYCSELTATTPPITTPAFTTTSPRITTPGGFSCQGKPDGNYADPDNCYGFISCSNGIAYKMNCPDSLMYNEAKDQCVYNAPCPRGVFSCQGKANGNYRDPDNCFGYIACSNGHRYKMPCPAALKYNEKTDQCAYNAPCDQGSH
ncbi:pancreatic secretory granule membrane major glycoprotein GP2-like [Montipora capricornis]|uniref:pancreatic secretory granule membrane major glycoprotein GP2-like n=1 Tax=Montipora capricornis TaxID=246305 RepID=UPI0035F1FEB7